MTKEEQQASDVMHRKLGVKCAGANIGQEVPVSVVNDDARLMLSQFDEKYILAGKSGQALLVITPADLAKLNRYAELLGWQCD